MRRYFSAVFEKFVKNGLLLIVVNRHSFALNRTTKSAYKLS